MSKDHCHEGSCSTGQQHCHHDHHDHHNHDSCCHEHHECDDFARELLTLADEAWMEVLKEKIKKQICGSGGSNMDELAKLIADTNCQRWENKLNLQNSIGDFRAKLDGFFKK